jgi:hypothetical protein
MKARAWIMLVLAVAVISMSGCKKKDTTVKQPQATPEAVPEAKETKQMSANKESFEQRPKVSRSTCTL